VSFADLYLTRYASGFKCVIPAPDPDVSFIVVIPSYNEPAISETLKSLDCADPIAEKVEILIVVNEPQTCPPEAKLQNHNTIEEIRDFIDSKWNAGLTIHILEPEPFQNKKAGPGLARKVGMDEAIRRFNAVKRPDGVLVSLDADTLVARNYFTALRDFYLMHPKANGCTIAFAHDILANHIPDTRGIIEYEIFLRHFKLRLEWLDHPFAAYTIGSAFSVRAVSYCKSGGMGIHQAGEDFYFIQKNLPFGKWFELNATTVYPSARASDRVPFGTGRFISNYKQSASETFSKYGIEGFERLKSFFNQVREQDLLLNPDKLNSIGESFPEWRKAVVDSQRSTSSVKSFYNKLNSKINVFQIIRFLNNYYKNKPSDTVLAQSMDLMKRLGLNTDDLSDSVLMLKRLRSLEKVKGLRRIC